jgi:hypothetical protein
LGEVEVTQRFASGGRKKSLSDKGVISGEGGEEQGSSGERG